MASVTKIFLTIQGKKVPLKIYHESRRNVRASIGKQSVILRMPWMMTKEQQIKQLQWCTDWAIKQFDKNEVLQARFFGKGYQDGDMLKVGEREYLLKFTFTDRKTHSAKLKNGVLHLLLSKGDSDTHLQKSIKHLLSRVIAQDFKPSISRRVLELNNLYFQKQIKSVNLKFNQTNWGSCSTQGNVNLSTRLLFAPDEVIDYVIIHELAHLIEMNHSDRFWKLVSDAMPDYKKKEDWLKKNGHLCQF